MGTRLQLQTLLASLLPTGKKAWYQPPASVELTYPTIVYDHDYTELVHANNSPYHKKRRYQVTVIDRNPDSPIVDSMEDLPLCRMVRKFNAEGLNHTIFDLYF